MIEQANVTKTQSRQIGFSLFEVAVVLLILTVLLGGVGTAISSRVKVDRIDGTKRKLAAIESALIQFVVQSGRLPCPADGRIATGGAGSGTEMARTPAVGCDSQQHGVVPWAALGLSEIDATDEWGTRITYRVGNSLTAMSAGVGAMNMSKCDPAAPVLLVGTVYTPVTPCNQACTSATLATNCTAPVNFLVGKGLNIQDASATQLINRDANSPAVPQGAAFVIVSHGPSAGGGYTSAGQIRPTSSGGDGTREQLNYANLGLQTIYTDSDFSDAAGNLHFDDFVLRPTILSVVSRAGLQPRSQP